MQTQEYRIPARAGQDEFTEKRSRFIGYVQPVESEQEALDFIASVKSRHWDAKHNVSAYTLREGNISRYSDDGEPSGTAGMPVLSVIQKHQLTNCAIVITRYFGGILLGGGGLVRAYSHAASIGIAAAGTAVMRLSAVCRLECDYSRYGRIPALIAQYGGSVTQTDFGAEVALEYVLSPDALGSMRQALADATGGTVTAQVLREEYVRME